MIVHLRLAVNACRHWFIPLATALKRLPACEVRLELVAPLPGAGSSSLDMLLHCEQHWLRRGFVQGARRCDPSALALPFAKEETADLVIDLTDQDFDPHEARLKGKRIFQVFFNGARAEAALAGFLVSGETPQISILEVGHKAPVACGRASLEAARSLGAAMEAVYSRVALLLERVLRGLEEKNQPLQAAPPPLLTPSIIVRYLLRGLIMNMMRVIYGCFFYPSHWRIGWRMIEGDGVFDIGALEGKRWQVIEHPVDHFYADPFPFEWQGKFYLFFEDFDHRLGKGVISYMPMGDNGPTAPAKVVLEEAWHLSYPFLIKHGGDVWMLPESSTNREVVLYRATSFPDKWERHTVLLHDVEASDATVIEYQNSWWMFAVTRDRVGGYSDTLSLYYADSLFGPWQAHPHNPVLINDRIARPAGHFILHNGELWRPVQDCSNGYGAALRLAKITMLDRQNFAQKIGKTLIPGNRVWPGRKLHTLNRAGPLEVIDGCIYRPKSKFLARLMDYYYRPH